MPDEILRNLPNEVTDSCWPKRRTAGRTYPSMLPAELTRSTVNHDALQRRVRRRIALEHPAPAGEEVMYLGGADDLLGG